MATNETQEHLIDSYARAALQGLLTQSVMPSGNAERELLAKQAWAMAAAMMEVRSSLGWLGRS